MVQNRNLSITICLTIGVMTLLSTCSTAQPDPTATPTAVPATDTAEPATATPIPATSTPVPPTPTPILPSPTPVPPTDTAVPTPTEAPTEVVRLGPSPRGYVAMAYDAESDMVILFGGQTGDFADPNSINAETWTYNLSTNSWTHMEPETGPTGRVGYSMAYDSESDRVILFGGFGGGNTTWAYDYNSNTWTELATGPEVGVGPSIAYDVESDRVILFGGLRAGGILSNDTWAYDYNSDSWKEMTPSNSPEGRNYHAMTYIPSADRVIMWGGEPNDERDNSVWAYDYNRNIWQEWVPEKPRATGASYVAMVYDSESDRIIQYGGQDYGRKDTWVYDFNTNAWTKMQPSINPGLLSRHAMVYYTSADLVILFGGQMGSKQYKYSGEIWTYDFNTNTWTNVTP